VPATGEAFHPMPYLPLIIAGCAIFAFGVMVLAYGIRHAPEQPDEENHPGTGPDGSTDNGTKS